MSRQKGGSADRLLLDGRTGKQYGSYNEAITQDSVSVRRSEVPLQEA